MLCSWGKLLLYFIIENKETSFFFFSEKVVNHSMLCETPKSCCCVILKTPEVIDGEKINALHFKIVNRRLGTELGTKSFFFFLFQICFRLKKYIKKKKKTNSTCYHSTPKEKNRNYHKYKMLTRTTARVTCVRRDKASQWIILARDLDFRGSRCGENKRCIEFFCSM